MQIESFKKALRRLNQATEFRIVLLLCAVGALLYPFFRYQNLENPWLVYVYIMSAWLTIILVLFLLSLIDDYDPEEDEDLL